jgi:hypothetical protein
MEIFVVSKISGTKASRSFGKRARSAQLDPDPCMRSKIIDFEVAKWAIHRDAQPDRQGSLSAGTPSRLPDLALEDWFDWTALGALFGAVALFPFLVMIFG